MEKISLLWSLSLSSLLLRLSFSLLYAKAVIYMSIYARLLISPTQRDLLRGGILGPWRHPWFSGCYVLASNRPVVPDVPRALPRASRLSVLLNRYGVTSVYRHTYTTPPRPSVSGSFLPTDPDRQVRCIIPAVRFDEAKTGNEMAIVSVLFSLPRRWY